MTLKDRKKLVVQTRSLMLVADYLAQATALADAQYRVEMGEFNKVSGKSTQVETLKKLAGRVEDARGSITTFIKKWAPTNEELAKERQRKQLRAQPSLTESESVGYRFPEVVRGQNSITSIR